MAVNYVGVGVCLGAVIRQCRRPRTLPALFRPPKRRQLFRTRPSCQGNAAVVGETLQLRIVVECCCWYKNGSLGGHLLRERNREDCAPVFTYRNAGSVVAYFDFVHLARSGPVGEGGSSSPSTATGRFCKFRRNMCVVNGIFSVLLLLLLLLLKFYPAVFPHVEFCMNVASLRLI